MTRAVQVFTGEGVDYDPMKLDSVVDLQDGMPVQVRLPYVKVDPYKENFFINDVGTFYGIASGRVVRNMIHFGDDEFFTNWDALGEIVVWTMDGKCYRVKHCWRPYMPQGYATMVIVGHSIEVEDQSFEGPLAKSDELLEIGRQMQPADPQQVLRRILEDHGGLRRNFPSVIFYKPSRSSSVKMPSINILPDVIAVQPMKDPVSPEWQLNGEPEPEPHIPEIDIEITSEEITTKRRKLNVKISGFGIPEDGPYNGF